MKALLFGLALAMMPVAASAQDNAPAEAGDELLYKGAPLPPLSSSDMNKAVAFIEGHVRLPEDAHPLKDYARYYAQDKGLVFALYAYPYPGKNGVRRQAGVHIVGNIDDLPGIMDGGCDIIDLIYVPPTGKLVADCHGDA